MIAGMSTRWRIKDDERIVSVRPRESDGHVRIIAALENKDKPKPTGWIIKLERAAPQSRVMGTPRVVCHAKIHHIHTHHSLTH